jgi:hypothetical protein
MLEFRFSSSINTILYQELIRLFAAGLLDFWNNGVKENKIKHF